jgi:glucose/arabinose dehydrogenase
MPTPAAGLGVTAFATDLDHPRWVAVLPNGDVLAVESNKPQSSGGFSGVKGWIAKKMMNYAGAGTSSADRITLLRDADGDGVAEFRSTLLEGLYSPFGVTLVEDWLYVANADALVRFPYSVGDTVISVPAEKIVDLPGGPRNHHWTKNVIASADGSRLYVAVGSNSNIGENGLEAERDRAAILEVDPLGKRYRVFASGLRNPVGMAWEPHTGRLWTAVNERDELGDQLVPDYITSVVDGGFYGWPWSYWGGTVDQRVQPQEPAKVAAALTPDYAVGAHTASLGLAFYNHDAIPGWRGHALVGQHGSWNRSPRSGYKVIRVPFEDGRPAGMPSDVLTGFLSIEGEAYGRPAGVAVDHQGGILVADDVGNAVWRVAPTP